MAGRPFLVQPLECFFGPFGMIAEALPVPRPHEWLLITNRDGGENTAAVKHGGGHGCDPSLRRFQHDFVEVDDWMHNQ